jgi:ATP-dependent exoDNAse (exonuclease V) alpha subunit
MQQQTALDIMMSGRNVFLTGPAGSGKTYTLNRYIKEAKSRGARVAITASTGIASTHLGGMTVHSWSGIGAKDALSDRDIRDLVLTSYLKKRFIKTDILVIDEISMITSHLFDLIDKVCRAGRGEPDKPFGGLQVILCGDLFQLPPVIKEQPRSNGLFEEENTSFFVFESRAWQEADLAMCYLETQYRQDDDRLIDILEKIRANAVDDSLRDMLQEHIELPNKGESAIDLFTHNIDVDRLNLRKLSLLGTSGKRYQMKAEGKRGVYEQLIRSCLAPETLVLREGARVVFVKNDPERSYVNGTLGVVRGFDEEGFPLVETKYRTIVAYPKMWELEIDGRKLASVEQIPLRLAWAITVHKSQGMTLESARVDLSKSFVPGMGYVALSRVRSLDGLDLLGCNNTALEVHPLVIEFDQAIKKQSEALTAEWLALSKEQRLLKKELFLKHLNKKSPKKESTFKKTKHFLRQKLSLEDIAEQRQIQYTTLLSHVEKLLEKQEISVDDIFYLLKEAPLKEKDFESIQKAFASAESYSLSPVFDHFQGKHSYETLRFVRLFLPRENV